MCVFSVAPICPQPKLAERFYIPQRGVQWKQGVVIYLTLYASLLYNTTPIHCTPDPLHPPLQSIQLVSSHTVLLLLLLLLVY